MSSTKGQIKLVFTFIIFIAVAGFIVVIGFDAVSGFISGQCEAERSRFLNDLTGYVESYDDYGSMHTERLDLPCEYTRVCMVNKSVSNGVSDFPSGIDSDGELAIQWATKVGTNIFLDGRFMEPWASSEKIVLSSGLACFNATGGAVRLRFEGEGQDTKITAP